MSENGVPYGEQPEIYQGMIELPVLWQKAGGTQYQVKLETIRYTNVQGGWDTVVDMLIEGLRMARVEARQAQAQRIQVAGQMPKGMN